jgi:hypothetical protein
MCNTLVSHSTDTGLHGGDFWVIIFHEYDSRSGPVRDAVERTFSGWLQRLEQLIATAIELGQLMPCDPAQLAFEIQALLNVGGHVFRLCHDPKAPERGPRSGSASRHCAGQLFPPGQLILHPGPD